MVLNKFKNIRVIHLECFPQYLYIKGVQTHFLKNMYSILFFSFTMSTTSQLESIIQGTIPLPLSPFSELTRSPLVLDSPTCAHLCLGCRANEQNGGCGEEGERWRRAGSESLAALAFSSTLSPLRETNPFSIPVHTASTAPQSSTAALDRRLSLPGVCLTLITLSPDTDTRTH